MDEDAVRKYRRGAGYVVVFAAAFLAWWVAVGPLVEAVTGWGTASPPPDSLRDRVVGTADTPYEYAKWAFVAGSLFAARLYDRRGGDDGS